MLAIRVFTTHAEFLAMQADWEDLLARASAANIFLTFDWLTAWWRYYGGAARLNILATYEEGELTGLAPLMIQERRVAGLPIYRHIAFLGTGISDRLDILLTPGRERTILEAIVSHLRGQQWDMVDLQEIPEDSVTASLLPGMAESLGARIEVAVQSVCPVIKLRADPDAYFATLGKKLRHNLAYYGRRLAREHRVAIDFLKGGLDLSNDLQGFFRVYRRSLSDQPAAQTLVGEKFMAFRHEVAARFATQGRLLLTLLRIDGTEAAGILCFPYRGTCYNYNLCHDPAWQRDSVGTLLQWETIRHAMTIGCHEYDCLRGDEAYKFQWGAQPRRHIRIRITRETPKTRLLQAGLRLARTRPRLRGQEWIG
jgi:CelD/BcsL family acetyltransferase involved in cellulose biosynthesis